MDALALLCNLYGEGPATLQRLRAAGRGSLESLESAPTEELARLLACTPDGARRFQREALLLRQRVEHAHSLPDEEIELEGEDAGALIEKALSAWRARDAEACARGEDAPVAERGTVAVVEVSAAPRTTGLEALAELDPATREALRASGARCLEELAELSAEELGELAARARLGLTRVIRIQFLARRRLAEAAGSECEVTLVPAPPPQPAAGHKPAAFPVPGPGSAAAVVQDQSAVGAALPESVQIAIASVREPRAPASPGSIRPGAGAEGRRESPRFSPSERPAEFEPSGLRLDLQVAGKPAKTAAARDAEALLGDEGSGGPFA